MKIGIVVPTRGDRPEFLKRCKMMIDRQSVKADEVLFVDHKPKSDKKDITQRYRLGYQYFTDKKFDLVFFMEDDDWYSEEYIETMLLMWKNAGCPDIFGTDHTIYYNVNLNKWLVMNHKTRSSAMSTMIKTGIVEKWCADDEPYTDMYLWTLIKNKQVFNPASTICMGIKHGTGLCGGYMHTNKLERYKFDDSNHEFLKKVVGKDYHFYRELSQK